MTRERYLSQLSALDQAVTDLGQTVLRTIDDSVTALEGLDVARAQQIIEDDNLIDQARHEIDQQAFLVLATQQPTAIDLRLVTGTTNIAGELERIGDYSRGIAKLTLTIAGEPKAGMIPQIRAMAALAAELLTEALDAFRDRNVEAAAQVWARDDEIDALYQEFFRLQIEDMVDHRKRVRSGTYLLWVAHNIERMADRVTNIAEAVAFIVTADVATWRKELEMESVPIG